METQSHPSNPPIDLPTQAWRYLVHTLYTLLPPPTIDTPEALQIRNHTAIARIAALAPVDAAEAELATQCIIARAQAEDVMRLIRLQNSDDLKLLMQLNNQYSRMVRTSLTAHSHLLKAQRQRRKDNEDSLKLAETTARLQQVTAGMMLDTAPLEPRVPTAPTEPEAPPAPLIQAKIPENETTSHDRDAETPLRQSPPRVVSVTQAQPKSAQKASPGPEAPPPVAKQRPPAYAMASG